MSATDEIVFFDSFCFDAAQQRLWRGAEEIPLRPKAFAVLQYLVQHSGRLVAKHELLRAVWPSISVNEAVLKVCISEIRRALGNAADGQPLIETRHRRGYRFVAATRHRDASSDAVSRQKFQEPAADRCSLGRSRGCFVGRQDELRRLEGCFERAWSGQRQTVFVTGEAGIGKTALVDAFLDRLGGQKGVWVARGLSLEQYGTGEPYQPILEALGQLCRQPGNRHLVSLLSAQAPTWMTHMPAAVGGAVPHANAPDRASHGPRDSMLREMTEAIASLTAERLMVLAVEDLHWADYWTLDLVAALAEHREPARLLLIGTARPLSGREDGRPLKEVRQQLQIHGRSLDLPLSCLGQEDLYAYVNARCLPGRLPAEFARTLHEKTEGNPLFMVGVVDDLHARAALIHRDGHWELAAPFEDLEIRVPSHLEEMIGLQLERLTPGVRQILDAASVVGVEFSASAVGAALNEDALPIEEQLEVLARQGQYLRSAGIARRADGKVTACFRFTHAFHRQVLYQAVQPRLRARWHQRVADHQAGLMKRSVVERGSWKAHAKVATMTRSRPSTSPSPTAPTAGPSGAKLANVRVPSAKRATLKSAG